MSATPISPLRQGLIEDMMARSFIARFRDAGLSHCLADAPPASATLRHVGLRCISRELYSVLRLPARRTDPWTEIPIAGIRAGERKTC